MLDFFGWYEFSIMCVIAGAYIHGSMQSKRIHVQRGVELTLKHLEDSGFIKVDEKTGEIASGTK